MSNITNVPSINIGNISTDIPCIVNPKLEGHRLILGTTRQDKFLRSLQADLVTSSLQWVFISLKILRAVEKN